MHPIARDGINSSVGSSGDGNAITGITVDNANNKISVTKATYFAVAKDNNTSCVQYASQAESATTATCLSASGIDSTICRDSSNGKIGVCLCNTYCSTDQTRAVTGYTISRAVSEAMGKTADGGAYIYYRSSEPTSAWTGCKPALIFYFDNEGYISAKYFA